MLTNESKLTLDGTLKATVTNLTDGAIQVVVHTQESLFTFHMVPDGPDGIRLEQFQPENGDLRLSTLASVALQAFLEQRDWQYVVALYPTWWQRIFASLGFHYLSERILWEIALVPEQVPSLILPPDDIQIKPLTASAERLGSLLSSAESNPAISPLRYSEFCRTLLTGAYGPLIEKGSYEICMQHEPFGACLFTNYYGEVLLAHIFIERTMQGHGFARTLLQYSLNALAQAGYPKATASTDINNAASRYLHAQVGFTELSSLNCSLLKKTHWKNGEAP